MIYREGKGSLADRRKMRSPGLWLVAREVYRGDRLVWGGVRSCFGSGVWIPDKPWLDNDNWKNNR